MPFPDGRGEGRVALDHDDPVAEQAVAAAVEGDDPAGPDGGAPRCRAHLMPPRCPPTPSAERAGPAGARRHDPVVLAVLGDVPGVREPRVHGALRSPLVRRRDRRARHHTAGGRVPTIARSFVSEPPPVLASAEATRR